ncbi:MAG: alpha/beta fold hydrolase [Alphaproteobacteria bacterium]|nr:alpha/beta fold hydrolase [Alphaproteobacteria bacterium]
MRASFIDVGGITTRYLHAGEDHGQALLLIHGGGVAADTWLCNIEPLGQEFAVYAPDNIGHGFTDAIELGSDLPQPHTTRHLVDFLDTLGIDRFSVAGSSYGALIAGLIYFEVPERVEKLILVGSSSVFDCDEKYGMALQGAYDNAAKTMGIPDLADCRRRMTTPRRCPRGFCSCSSPSTHGPTGRRSTSRPTATGSRPRARSAIASTAGWKRSPCRRWSSRASRTSAPIGATPRSRPGALPTRAA